MPQFSWSLRNPVPLSRRGVMRGLAAAVGASVAASALANPAGSLRRPGEVVLSRLPGLAFLPTYVMEKHKLIEHHAERLGLPGLNVRWVNISTGNNQGGMFLSGHVDIMISGLGLLLQLWDLTQGGVKGITALGGAPLTLVSVDPRIRSLRDIGETDLIAVPALQTSTQAVFLQMAAVKLYGPEAWDRFERNCVAVPHSNAMVMLRSQNSVVRSHFSAPPFSFYALKRIRGAHAVTTSTEIAGGAHSSVFCFSTVPFADANPLIIRAFLAAAADAKARIEKDTQNAVACYRDISSDKSDAADILEALAEPGMMNWDLVPAASLAYARHLHRVGLISRGPESWRDYHLPVSHGLPGS